MMMRFIWIFILSFYGSVQAQETPIWSATISQDSVGLGQPFQVSFTLENGKGRQFTPPIFDHFKASGPSTSSTMQVINGQVSQKISYTYYLEPQAEGVFTIAPARIQCDGTTLETAPLTVVVVQEPIYKGRNTPRHQTFDDFFRSPFERPQPAPPKRDDKPKKPYSTERI